MQNACPELCPDNCPLHTKYDGWRSCWDDKTCQRGNKINFNARYEKNTVILHVPCYFFAAEIACPPNMDASTCYRGPSPDSGQILECGKECIGGCAENDPHACSACKGVLFVGDTGTRRCMNFCPMEYLLVGQNYLDCLIFIPKTLYSYFSHLLLTVSKLALHNQVGVPQEGDSLSWRDHPGHCAVQVVQKPVPCLLSGRDKGDQRQGRDSHLRGVQRRLPQEVQR